MSDVTRILNTIEQGGAGATDKLLELVYEELRRLAAQKMAREKPGQTLQATALVHEAYIRLVGSEPPNWKSRTHFFTVAAEAMRRILIDNARRKKSIRHGGGHLLVNLDNVELAIEEPSEDIIALDEALEKLALEDPVKATLVKLRYFAGMTIEQAADILEISRATADRYWSYARVWLFHETSKDH